MMNKWALVVMGLGLMLGPDFWIQGMIFSFVAGDSVQYVAFDCIARAGYGDCPLTYFPDYIIENIRWAAIMTYGGAILFIYSLFFRSK